MQKSIFLFIFFAISLYKCQDLKELKTFVKVNDPDMYLNVTGLVESKDYPAESHTVQTTDGFLLGLQRIPHGKNGQVKGVKKPVVYLQHGLLADASDWVINFPCQSLGFILADAGYDVWLGNTRGNTYSRRHVKYSPKQREFWNFSFDEMAKYDLPATIDFILNATGEEKLYYIGHSQGTTSAFALLSESPKYNEKIKLFIALAPVTTVGYSTSIVRVFAPASNEIYGLSKLVGVVEFLPSNEAIKLIANVVCDTPGRFICAEVMFLLYGYDKYQLNETRLGVYVAHNPAGTSVKSLAHFGQMANSKLFTKYDYGSIGNKERYSQTKPPEYPVSNITAPVALMWSLNDKLADPVDVSLLEAKLKGKSLVFSYRVPFWAFNHGDFVRAKEAKRLVYDKLLELMKNY